MELYNINNYYFKNEEFAILGNRTMNQLAPEVVLSGWTYYSTQPELPLGVLIPTFQKYMGPSPGVKYMKMKTFPIFYVPNETRNTIINKCKISLAMPDPERHPNVPSEVRHFHSLLGLEEHDAIMLKLGTYFYITSSYKAINLNDNFPYFMKRIHGFCQFSQQCMTLVYMWKNVQHSNIVRFREVFTSDAFGDQSLIFTFDYHPGAETLQDKYMNPTKWYKLHAQVNKGEIQIEKELFPEHTLWIYVVQLVSALRCIHSRRLACRVVNMSKIIITDNSRLLISGVAIFDMICHDTTSSDPLARVKQYQLEDMVEFGKIVLALTCNSIAAHYPINIKKSFDFVKKNYSSGVLDLILCLLKPQKYPCHFNELLHIVGSTVCSLLESALQREDAVMNELEQEMHNGRLFRLISLLEVMNERSEFGNDDRWSEEGDWYMLKLYRNYLFHQVTGARKSWIDLPHIVNCLNKLDAGVSENLWLMSNREKNIIVVSYKELKEAFKKCYRELISEKD